MKNKCYLDSNLLVYFKTENKTFSPVSKKLLKYLIRKDIAPTVSPLVLDEFMYKFTKIADVPKAEIYKHLKTALNDVLEIPHIQIVNPPADVQKQKRVVKLMQKYKLMPRDAYHLLTILENKIKYIATFDKDFEKIPKTNLLKKYKLI